MRDKSERRLCEMVQELHEINRRAESLITSQRKSIIELEEIRKTLEKTSRQQEKMINENKAFLEEENERLEQTNEENTRYIKYNYLVNEAEFKKAQLEYKYEDGAIGYSEGLIPSDNLLRNIFMHGQVTIGFRRENGE